MLFHQNRLLLNALISKEVCFWNKAGRKKIFKCSFLNLLSLRPPGAWLQAHSIGDGACFERKEVETPKPISLATMPRITLTSTCFLHKSLMKTNWRGKSSQLAFIKNKSCQNKVMAFLSLGDLLEGEGESGGYQGGYHLTWEVFWCCHQQSSLIHSVGEVTRKH